MPQIRIDDLEDPRIGAFRHLKRTNATRWARSFVVEGDKLVERLLASPYPVESILAGEGYCERLTAVVPGDLPVYVVPDKLVEHVVGFNFHRGMLACGRRLPERPLASLCPSGGALTLVICVDVHDPENLGAILRSSAAFGASGVVLGGRTADPLSRRVLRVSMGAALGLPLVYAPQLPSVIAELRRQQGVRCWATVLDEAAPRLGDIERPERLALLLGNEGHGLNAEWREMCDAAVTIPMPGGIDSLNVAVAAGIFLYRTLSPPPIPIDRKKSIPPG